MQLFVCRSAHESLTPGATLGYKCAICSEPLQVSERMQSAANDPETRLFCNPCGLSLIKQLDVKPKIRLTETAREQLEKNGPGMQANALAQWVRENGYER